MNQIRCKRSFKIYNSYSSEGKEKEGRTGREELRTKACNVSLTLPLPNRLTFGFHNRERGKGKGRGWEWGRGKGWGWGRGGEMGKERGGGRRLGLGKHIDENPGKILRK